MKKLRSLAICSVVVLAACSGSDADTSTDDSGSPDESAPSEAEPDVEATTPTLDGDSAGELCPDAAALSTATGVELSEPAAGELAGDPLGTDPTAGATSCAYDFPDNSTLAVTLHNSPIDTVFLENLPENSATVTQLPTGELQVQFNGQPGCELYGEEVSVVAFVAEEIPDLDTCALVGNALAAIESA